MAPSLQAVRGMNDLLPAEVARWQRVERRLAQVLTAYGYQEIRLPIVEPTALFERSIGEVTDIVEKEMYTFLDRSGDSLTLRPEGTAGVVRAGVQHGLLYNQQQRWWYRGPMFRHERPQQGRYRQFHQLGVESFGCAGPDIDLEQIALSARLWQRLGLAGLRLELNSLGTPASRARYRDLLQQYFGAHEAALDEDSRRRLHRNPLRLLDSKNPELQSLIAEAPQLAAHLDEESAAHFAALRAGLDALGIDYVCNPRLVRGLDYYSRTVFEWTTDRLGAQNAVCSGGRYDGLVEQLGGPATPAFGFAIGIERLLALLALDGDDAGPDAPHVYLIWQGEAVMASALQLAEQWREALPGLRLMCNAGGGSFKAQFKRADRSGAAYAAVLGESELAAGQVQFKPLRIESAQQQVALGQAIDWLRTTLIPADRD